MCCRRSPLSIRLWFLLFKTLTIASNLPSEEDKSNKNGNEASTSKSTSCMGAIEIIIRHETFPRLLSEFLSCPFVDDMVNNHFIKLY